MSTNMDWILATQKYQAERGAKKLAETERRKSEEAKKQKELEEARKKQEEILQGVEQLREFLMFEGTVAMRLLQASGNYIVLGEDNGGGFLVVFLINGEGLYKSVEASGMGANTKPVLTRISNKDAIEVAVNHGGKKATEVVSWIRSQLNRIAEAAPK